MKSLALNDAHDIVIKHGKIQLAEGAELKRQSAECVLNIKKGEWQFDPELGVDFSPILRKNPDLSNDTLKGILMDGLTQVDESFVIQQIISEYDKPNRKLTAGFTATTEDGEIIALSDVWRSQYAATDKKGDLTVKLSNGSLVVSGGGISARIVNGGLVFALPYNVSIVDEGMIVGG